MFDVLVKQIEALENNKPTVVVGISGFGGSGKTTLANKLRDYFNIKDEQVVRLDNIFAKDHENKQILEDYDWEVITTILEDAKCGKGLQYVGRGFYGEKVEVDQPLPKVIIIEGVRLFTPDSTPYFDVTVWINCPIELATRRGEERDKGNGADEEHIKRWVNEWVPKDNEYVEKYYPKELATFLYEEY